MISPTYPDVRDRDTFAVMQACRILDITRTTLAKYERQGFIISSIRKADGRKVYTGKALKDFYKTISFLH